MGALPESPFPATVRTGGIAKCTRVVHSIPSRDETGFKEENSDGILRAPKRHHSGEVGCRDRARSQEETPEFKSALVVLAERGLEAEAEERASLNATYRRFMSESDPERKGDAGKDLIRAVFGKDAIAEDPLL